jgi:hypothetical protein
MFHSFCFRCVLCGLQIVDGTYFIAESDLICGKCIPPCYLCGTSGLGIVATRFGEYLFSRCEGCQNLLTTNELAYCHSCQRLGWFSAVTGAKICQICKRFAGLVQEPAQVHSISEKVVAFLKEHLRLSLPPIPIEFMHHLSPWTLDHQDEIRLLGLAILVTRESVREMSIKLLHNLSTITTACTLVHEFLHCWLFFNRDKHQIRCHLMEEGVCRLAEHLFRTHCQTHPDLFSLSKWQKSILVEALKEHDRITGSRTCHSQHYHVGLFEVANIFAESSWKQNFESFIRHEIKLAALLDRSS